MVTLWHLAEALGVKLVPFFDEANLSRRRGRQGVHGLAMHLVRPSATF